jgi:ribonucleoside-diphosphate reductase alpha chain
LKWEVSQHVGRQILSERTFERIHDAILNMRVMPSMRLLAMAGPAAMRNSIALYNCSFIPVLDIESFVEALLISMAGCGVGYSVEKVNVEEFPRVQRQTGKMHHFVIGDSTEGWAEALSFGLHAWWEGEDVTFDTSFLRPTGAILKTKGGRASGPGPLISMLALLRSTLLSRQGGFLRTTDAHLMMCAVGEAAVQGGVRRTAMISLFDWDDDAMRHIKSSAGMNPLLYNANNSAVWPEDISSLDIAQQMIDMAKSNSGEPGIFSRHNANTTKPARRQEAMFGINPCGEIFLRPFEFCNLTQAVARPGDTFSDLADKVELATIIGKIQSLSTRFPGLRPDWKRNCEEERLLGVDLTAQNDCELLRAGTLYGASTRRALRQIVLDTDKEMSELLGVNISAATTCNKPAGNSTELLGASSNGIHRPHSKFYIRRMLVSTHSPLFRVLREAGAPMAPSSGQAADQATTWVVEFPKAAPEGAPVKGDATAVEQCEFWLLNKLNWTEHNPSATVNYKPHEVIDLIKWVAEHSEQIGGLSFFPEQDAIYPQQPFEEITEDEYKYRVAKFPVVDYALIYSYELSDMTTASQELACFAGSCSITY